MIGLFYVSASHIVYLRAAHNITSGRYSTVKQKTIVAQLNPKKHCTIRTEAPSISYQAGSVRALVQPLYCDVKLDMTDSERSILPLLASVFSIVKQSKVW